MRFKDKVQPKAQSTNGGKFLVPKYSPNMGVSEPLARNLSSHGPTKDIFLLQTIVFLRTKKFYSDEQDYIDSFEGGGAERFVRLVTKNLNR